MRRPSCSPATRTPRMEHCLIDGATVVSSERARAQGGGAMESVIVVGAGIGGLALALTLHRGGIPAQVYEAAPEIRPVGVGINVLPHATQELARLGLEPALAAVAV